MDGLGAQVIQLEQNVVLVGSAATAFLDFLVHATGHEVTRGQVLQGGGVALHEAFAIGVEQDGSFTTAAFGQQHARAGHAGGVKLPELHVFQRDAGARRHAQAVTGVDEGVGGGSEDAAGTASGQQHGLGLQDVQVTGFHFQGSDAHHITFGVADQVQGHPFHEESGAGGDVLLVQGVQHRVTGAVSGGASTLHRLFAVVGGVSTERTLVDGAVRVAVKRHAHVLEVIHDLRGFTAHELDRILVAEPVRALDGVVEVVVPVVVGHVAQRGTDAALRCHGVRTGGEHFGQHGHVQAGAGQLQGGTHAGTTGAEDHDVKFAGGDLIFGIAHGLESCFRGLRGSGGSEAPQDLNSPAGAAGQPDDGKDVQHQAHTHGLDVVHPDVAHTDPHVPQQGHDDGEGEELHPLGGEDAGPLLVANGTRGEDHLGQQHQGEQGHEGASDALDQPVAETITSTDDGALGAVVDSHGFAPSSS